MVISWNSLTGFLALWASRRRSPCAVCLLAVLVAGTIVVPASAVEGRLIAIADIHGAYDEFVELLRETGLTDENENWIGGTTTLVQTGDFLDRGADVRKTMDLLRSLQEQAALAGGEVVVLLGNHEAMNLLGFRRDINPEAYSSFADEESERRLRGESRRYGKWLKQRAKARKERAPVYGSEQAREFSEKYPPGYFEYVDALSPGGEYGDWVRSLPMIAERQHIAFLHGGLSLKYVGWSIDELNQRMWQEVALLDACREQLLSDGVIFATSDPNEMVVEGLAEIALLTKRVARAPAALQASMIDSLRLLEGCVGYQDWFLVKNESPIWYRGYARLESEEALEVVTRGLEGLGVNRFVVGHTPQKPRRVKRRLDGRVFLLDTGMLTKVYKGRAAALEFKGREVNAIYVGEKVALEPVEALQDGTAILEREGAKESDSEKLRSGGSHGQDGALTPSLDKGVSGLDSPVAGPPPAAAGFAVLVPQPGGLAGSLVGAFGAARPLALLAGGLAWAGSLGGSSIEYYDADGKPLPFASENELVAFLARGAVEFVGQTDTGINRPRKAKVTAGGVTIDAVFRTVDSFTPKFRTRQDVLLPFLRDSFRYEPAAYRLSVALGLGRVPATVLRTVGGKRGSLQVWLHGVVDEESRLERKQPVRDRARWRRQVAERMLFDRLIGNVDRNQGNLLMHSESEKVWLIDHTRSFAELSEPPELQKVTRCRKRFYELLQSADEKQVREWMTPYLLKGEIAALWKRWQAIVGRLDQLVREYGEKTILYRS